MIKVCGIPVTVWSTVLIVVYARKFHCGLNHIEYFWCHSKRYARENCDYTIEGLREHAPASLAHVRNSTILACYWSCIKKDGFISARYCVWIERVRIAYISPKTICSG